jgi:hypothetical protein
MSLIVSAQNCDRLLLGAAFEAVVDRGFAFARIEAVAHEIEERFALHLSIIARRIAGDSFDRSKRPISRPLAAAARPVSEKRVDGVVVALIRRA